MAWVGGWGTCEGHVTAQAPRLAVQGSSVLAGLHGTVHGIKDVAAEGSAS